MRLSRTLMRLTLLLSCLQIAALGDELVGEPDKSELRALARLLPEGHSRDAVLKSLLLLKARPERPVEVVLPRVLDRLWESLLRARAEAAFSALANPPARPANNQVDPAVQPASAKRPAK